MFNSSHEPVEFTLPEVKWGQRWAELLDTNERDGETEEERVKAEFRAGGKVKIPASGLALLRRID